MDLFLGTLFGFGCQVLLLFEPAAFRGTGHSDDLFGEGRNCRLSGCRGRNVLGEFTHSGAYLANRSRNAAFEHQ